MQADRSTEKPEELAARTVAHLKAKHSPEERMESGNAMYDKDEIAGPLKGAASGAGTSATVEDTSAEAVQEKNGEWRHTTARKHKEVEEEVLDKVKFIVLFPKVFRLCFDSLDFILGQVGRKMRVR